MELPAVVRKRQRIHKLSIVPERSKGKIRFKVAGYYVDGKRVRKYFDTRAVAETFVAAEQIRRENLGQRAARVSGALVEDALRASDALKLTPYGLIEAARLVAHAHAKLGPLAIRIEDAIDKHAADVERRLRSVSVAKLVEEFRASRQAKGKSAIYLRDLRSRLGRFQATFCDRIVADFAAREIDEWIQSLNVGPQTQNNFRAVLSAMWTFAVRRGYAESNIVRLVDKSAVARDHVPVFTVTELRNLLEAAGSAYLPVLAIGAFAGLRPEEINKLRWEDIDFQERTIRVNATASKTRKKRFAEVSENLKAWLDPHIRKAGPVAPRNLRRLRRSAMKKAGLCTWPQDGLRHSFASAHYAFHKNPAHTAMLLGHRDQDMLLTHYRDLMKPSDAALYWQIMPEAREVGRKIIAMVGE
jgi:integrase/recombinase XerD